MRSLQGEGSNGGPNRQTCNTWPPSTTLAWDPGSNRNGAETNATAFALANTSSAHGAIPLVSWAREPIRGQEVASSVARGVSDATRTAALGRTAAPDAYTEVATLMVILMFAPATRDPASRAARSIEDPLPGAGGSQRAGLRWSAQRLGRRRTQGFREYFALTWAIRTHAMVPELSRMQGSSASRRAPCCSPISRLRDRAAEPAAIRHGAGSRQLSPRRRCDRGDERGRQSKALVSSRAR